MERHFIKYKYSSYAEPSVNVLKEGEPLQKNVGRQFGGSPQRIETSSLDPKYRLNQCGKQIIDPLSIRKVGESGKGKDTSFDYSSPLLGVSEGESKKVQLMKEYQTFAMQQLRQQSNISPTLAKKKSFAIQGQYLPTLKAKEPPQKPDEYTKQEYMEELKAQIRLREETRRKEKEKERLDAVKDMRGLTQSTNSPPSHSKALLRDELLAQIEEKKKRLIGKTSEIEQKEEPQKLLKIIPTKPPISGDTEAPKGIEDFLTRLKLHEKEAEQKRQETLRQLERIKQEIQKSIKEDREERMLMAQGMGSHFTKPQMQRRQVEERNEHIYDVMSITSGTSLSSGSLAQNSQFVGIYKK